jgi:hypothetical protein
MLALQLQKLILPFGFSEVVDIISVVNDVVSVVVDPKA